MIASILTVICLTNVISGCGSEEDEPKQEIKKILVDKQDSIFLDNGKYVKATTSFTQESAELLLRSKIWRKAKWYIYDTYNIVSFTRSLNICYKFYENNQYQYLLDAPTQEKMDNQLETSPFIDYTVKGKTLMFEDAPSIPYTIIAIDENRIVLDRLCNAGDWTVSKDFPKDFDTNISKVRCVLTPWSPN